MKNYLSIVILLFLGLSLNAQAPQGFNYQATVRNSAGELIIKSNVYFKFNVIQGSQTAVPIFTETHYVPTDDLGQVNLVIGKGTPLTGTLSELDWSSGSYYLGIELSINGANDYVAMGTTQLLSVPYALYAANAGNGDEGVPTLESVLAENNDANSQQLRGLADPTDDQDATTKAYTDALITNLQSQIDNLDSPAVGIQLPYRFDQSGSDVFDNPITNESELVTMLANTQELLTSYSWSVMAAEIASDNALKGGDARIDRLSFAMIDDFTLYPTNQVLSDIWNTMYGGYNRASYAYIKGKEIPNVSQNYLAEALFLRAFYAYNLIEWFGHFPRINEYDDNNDPILSYSSRGVRINLLIEIKAMLEQAILITVDHGVSSSGRSVITKNAMLAFLSKTLVKMRNYGEAKNVLDEIISSNQYSLGTNYETIFDDGLTASSVFDIDCTDAIQAGWGNFLLSQGNLMAGFQGIRNYVGPEYSYGYGFNIPTEESYNSFESGDIRRDIAILNITEWVSQTGASYTEGYQHTGFFNKKYLPRRVQSQAGNTALTNGNDIKVVRYAELLLLRSELSFYTGEANEALYYLNLVRNRAGLEDIIIEDVSSNNFNSELGDFILQERRSEFMGEGKRFFDLVRLGKASENLPGFTDGKNEVFPIPQSFIDLVNFSEMGIIIQNPGYYSQVKIEDFNLNVDDDGDGYTENQGDCDDTDASVNPAATELEDGIDNDCDGEIDEGNISGSEKFLAGPKLGDSKTWVWASDIPSHIGLGPVGDVPGEGEFAGPSWWGIQPNDTEKTCMYTNEFVFTNTATGLTFEQTVGSAYVPGTYRDIIGVVSEGCYDDTVATTMFGLKNVSLLPSSSKAAIEGRYDGVPYTGISFTISDGGFMGWYTGSVEYDIISISANTLHVRFIQEGGGFAWYAKYKSE